MPEHALGLYLNDHLAASVGALAMMERLEAAHVGSDVARIVASVRVEVEGEQALLRSLIAKADSTESVPRKMAGWLAERFAQLKLQVDSPSESALRLLEATEMLAVGISGKTGLWRALALVSPAVTALRGPDYDALVAQSMAQHERVEGLRMQAAGRALSEEPHD